MIHHHLKGHDLRFHNLDPDLKKKVKDIVNGPENMAVIPASINMGKGQLIKNAMKGKAITPKKDRDDYALLSYGTAKKTAKKLDDAFKQHNHDFGKKGFQDTLHKTFVKAKLNPAQLRNSRSSSSSRSLSPPKTPKTPKTKSSRKPPSPGASGVGSPKAGPRRTARTHAWTKPKVITPTRKSARIAARPPKKPGKK